MHTRQSGQRRQRGCGEKQDGRGGGGGGAPRRQQPRRGHRGAGTANPERAVARGRGRRLLRKIAPVRGGGSLMTPALVTKSRPVVRRTDGRLRGHTCCIIIAPVLPSTLARFRSALLVPASLRAGLPRAWRERTTARLQRARLPGAATATAPSPASASRTRPAKRAPIRRINSLSSQNKESPPRRGPAPESGAASGLRRTRGWRGVAHSRSANNRQGMRGRVAACLP